MGRNNHKSNRKNQGRALRKLQFDSLEDRRLLAGLTVFVFEDSDGSGQLEVGEQGRADQVVFLDDDANGQFDVGERWVRTTPSGQAFFDDLEPGVYHPTLFGNRSDTLQTTPVAPSASGNELALPGLQSILSWSSNSQLWVARPGSIDLIDFANASPVATIPVAGKLISASIDSLGNKGLLIVESEGGLRSLVSLDLVGKKAHTIVSSNGLHWSKVGRTSFGFFAQQISELEGSTVFAVDVAREGLTPINGLLIDGASQVYGSENSPYLFAVRSEIGFEASTTWLQSYRLESGNAILERSRPFSTSIELQAIDPAGHFLVVRDSASRTVVLKNETFLDESFVFDEPTSLAAFDPLRGILATYNGQVIETRRLGTWELVDQFQPQTSLGGRALQSNLLLSPSGRQLAGATLAGLYTHFLAEKKSISLELTDSGSQSRVLLGTQLTGRNIAPSSKRSGTLSTEEDTSLVIAGSGLSERFQDADGDALAVFVVDAPRNGQLQWSPWEGGQYHPLSNFEGLDRVVLQAFDGRDWSAPQSVPIQVLAVNDLPTGFDFQVPSIHEDVKGGTDLGLVTVLDPDRDASYRVTVGDSRLLVINGVLKMAQGASFNYETEPTITFELIATDENHPLDTVVRTVTLDVADENDAPTDIVLDFEELSENVEGGIVGSVQVLDEDRNESFRWFVSDTRFQIIDGKLVLQTDTSVDFESQSTVPITLTAVDQQGKGVAVTKSAVIQVRNEDDPTLAIQLEKESVVERVRGFRVGKITVFDQDTDEDFILDVSDPRFIIVDNVLRLKPGLYVEIAAGDSIPVEITATSQASGKSFTQSLKLKVMANSNPWRNIDNPLDVDGDGRISPIDPLRIINHINRNGIHMLGEPPAGTEGEQGGGDYLDVNGDGKVSPIDILIVINHLNNRAGGNSGSPGGSPGGGSGGSSGGGSGSGGGGSGGGGGVGEGESSPLASDQLSAPVQVDMIQANQVDLSLSAYLEDVAKDQEIGPKRSRKR